MAARAAAPTKTRSTANGSRQRAGKPVERTITVPKDMLAMADDTETIVLPDANKLPSFSTKFKPKEENPFGETEPVFEIDGVVYEAPVRVPASWGLRFVYIRVTYGIDMAVIYAMEQGLGSSAVQKLTEVPDLEPEQLNNITKMITKKFLDATSDPKGR